LYNLTEAIRIKINETPNGFETIKNQSSIGVVNPKYDYAKIFIAIIIVIIIVVFIYWFYNQGENPEGF
jgi:hypothetical protein